MTGFVHTGLSGRIPGARVTVSPALSAHTHRKGSYPHLGVFFSAPFAEIGHVWLIPRRCLLSHESLL